MKKFVALILSCVLCCTYSPVCVNAVEMIEDTQVTVENSPELWERFLKYDLCILDYDSLTGEEKDLCKFIFETELNSEDTIICERARRILGGYDVGRRATLEDTEKYYDFADFNHMYAYCYNKQDYMKVYLDIVPDIKHLDWYNCYNEYWIDDKGYDKILSSGEKVSDYYDSLYKNMYSYIELDDNRNLLKESYISRPDVNFETISDDTFTYVIYPDNTLYVLKPNEHLKSYEIPEEVNGMKVIGIKIRAFESEGFYSVTFPESIEYIEPFAFVGCTFLEEVNIPKNLKYLGKESFMDCNSLKNIVIDCPKLMCISSGLYR